MTLRTCDSSVPTSAAICCGFILVADAQQINARSRLTSDAALRESRLSRLPSSGNSSLTNTDGGRITTSKLRMRPSSPTSHDFRSTDTRRATSPKDQELAELTPALWTTDENQRAAATLLTEFGLVSGDGSVAEASPRALDRLLCGRFGGHRSPIG